MSAEKLAYLEERLQGRAASTGNSKSKFLLQYRYFSITLAIIAAVNTFFVAMGNFGATPNQTFLIGALILGGVLTIITAWQASINPKEKFSRNADALNKIIDLRERLEWRKLDRDIPLRPEELDEMFLKFRALEKSFFSSVTKSSIQDSE